MSAREYDLKVPNLFLESCIGTVPVLMAANTGLRAAIVGVGMIACATAAIAAVGVARERADADFARNCALAVAAFVAGLYALGVAVAFPSDFPFLGPVLPLVAFNTLVLLGLRRHGAAETANTLETFAALALWTVTVVAFGFARELLGHGGFAAPNPAPFARWALPYLLTPGGGFLVFGLMAGVYAVLRRNLDGRKP